LNGDYQFKYFCIIVELSFGKKKINRYGSKKKLKYIHVHNILAQENTDLVRHSATL